MRRTVFYTPIKRSHLVAPFGVGALLLSRNGVSVIVCGLDEYIFADPVTPSLIDWRSERVEAPSWGLARSGVLDTQTTKW